MEVTSATALLVGTPDMLTGRSGSVTATVPREEIEEALAAEPPAELVLEILRNVEDRSEVERRTVKVAWDRADLQSVLAAPDGSAITFSFDPVEIERALDAPEVEGHGLREAAVVLSIAAAAAAAGTSAAYGQPDPAGAAAQVAVGGHDEATLAERGIGIQISGSHDEAGLTARGIEATQVASHDEVGLSARGVEPGTLAASHDEVGLSARGVEPGYLAASHDEASLTARGIETGAEPVSLDAGSRFDLPSVDPGVAVGIAGGLAGAGLLIVAASFATRRREPGAV